MVTESQLEEVQMKPPDSLLDRKLVFQNMGNGVRYMKYK